MATGPYTATLSTGSALRGALAARRGPFRPSGAGTTEPLKGMVQNGNLTNGAPASPDGGEG